MQGHDYKLWKARLVLAFAVGLFLRFSSRLNTVNARLSWALQVSELLEDIRWHLVVGKVI